MPAPGRPFDAADVLEAMRSSRRPGGVPDQLETDAIASAVAEELWTFGGEPWTSMTAGGSCGPESCTLEISGMPDSAMGEDVWVFSVMPGTSSVEVTETNLRGFPAAMLEPLDALARAAHPVDDLRLISARWLPPPDIGLFSLSYRSGGEEGSCGADLVLHAPSGRIAEDLILDC